MTATPFRARWPKFALLMAPAMLTACSAPTVADTPAAANRIIADDAAKLAERCAGRDGWADPAPPARVYGNTWYVGTCGITVLLVTSTAGHVLIDGGPAEAAPLVAANIEKLGYRLTDIKWIVSSHEHDDHVGALAELKQMTGAKVAALVAAALALAAGKPGADDPQRAIAKDFAPIAVDRVLDDGSSINLALLRLTVHATPTHSPGSASWTWQSCEGAVCRTITYADSATAISADGYRFTDHPERVRDAKTGLDRIGRLPCGILLTPHPAASDMFARLAGKASLANEQACRAYADAANTRLSARLADEAKAASQ